MKKIIYYEKIIYYYNINTMNIYIKSFTSIVAILAVFLSMVQIFPQMHKLYKKKSIGFTSISSIYLGLFAAVVWSLYGYMNNDFVTVLSSVITAILHSIMIFSIYFI
jgi:uncharacterized protein with PQ loop repeat